MLRFNVDWEDNPRVRDPILRATWARLEIFAGDGARDFCFTECVGERSKSLRQGVYGSVFPLARWITENWWSLLHESMRTDSFRSARYLACDEILRPWVQRHNLLAARCGFALPDLSILRDGDHVAVQCCADPFDCESRYPVRFVQSAELRLTPESVAAGLAGFVNSVAERVRENAPREPETQEFLANWEAVQESAQSESSACAVAAMMGLDPYDPDELTDGLVEVLEGPFAALAAPLSHDLAEATTGATVATDLDWVLKAVKLGGGTGSEESAMSPSATNGAVSAHEAGYDQARRFIETFQWSPRDDLHAFLRDRCGWSADAPPARAADGVAQRIVAYVGPDRARKPMLVPAVETKREDSRRFLLGRALFFVHSANAGAPRRLLTQAHAWQQRASRAFAAELLAPADELRRRAEPQVSYERVAEIAREFQVSVMVIEHQLKNHRIARIVDL